MELFQRADRLITLGLISLTYCWWVWFVIDQYIRPWLCIASI